MKKTAIILIGCFELSVDCVYYAGFKGSNDEPAEKPGWSVTQVLLRFGKPDKYQYIDLSTYYLIDSEFSDEVDARVNE